MVIGFPFTAQALLVDQPIGPFLITVLPAELLLQVAASDLASATLNPDGKGYTLQGTQRFVQDKRLSQIADYINRVDFSFPNSIILAANYNLELGFDQEEVEAIKQEENGAQGVIPSTDDETSIQWTITKSDGRRCELNIPSPAKLAAIIDGQHRLFAFAKADSARREINLVCAIFLDIPKPVQAQLFAIINSNQKPVDRSLTAELFGYNVADEVEALWTPDKLAVFLARKLGTEEASPLRGRISMAPKRDLALQTLTAGKDWKVSTAVIVDGILRLFTSNPKRDANTMRTPDVKPRTSLRSGTKDRSPLRDIFIEGNDLLIYRVVENYVVACDKVFWREATTRSFIKKTVGVQALFDLLRKLTPNALRNGDFRVEYFEAVLQPASHIDFSINEFQSPSGSGRTAIRRAIEELVLS